MGKPKNNAIRPHKTSPVQLIVFSFVIIILTGTLLLMLPLSSNSGAATPFTDALFTATSATCVTGLTVVETLTHWTLFGQLVILILIQLGALGFATLFTFIALAFKSRLGLRDLQLVQESSGANGLDGLVRVLRITVGVTFICEAVGALFLMMSFVPEFGARGIYISIFMSVSAYCNAGFDILGPEKASVSAYNGDPVVILTLTSLTIIGGLGFIVMADVYNIIFKKNNRTRLSTHSQVVLISAAVLTAIGALIIFIFEYNNTLSELSLGEKLGAAYFQSVSARTAGFYSVDLKSMHSYTKLIYVLLMFIGAAPGSTGGGVKTTVIVVIIMTVICVMRGEEDTVIRGRRVSRNAVYKALSILSLGLLIVVIVTFSIIICMGDKNVSSIDALFEATSAFATTGSSCSLTPSLPLIPKLTVTLTMFIGRVGPLSLSLAISGNKKNTGDAILPGANIIVG